MDYRIGIDLGGTKLAVGIVDSTGKIISEVVSHDHVTCDDAGIVECMVRNVEQAKAKLSDKRIDIAGVGVVFPGHVRWPDGITLTTSNLKGMRNFPLKDILQKRLDCPVIVDNDANAQTLGEYYFGAGRGSRNMVFMTVSTGVGGGIIINGQLYRGATGTAGEFGHMIIDISGTSQCTCGNKGCLMSMSSGISLPQTVKRIIEQQFSDQKDTLLPKSCAAWDSFTGEHLSKGFYEDNKLCHAVIKEYGTNLGVGLYNIFQILNPERVVFGGGLMNLPDFFFETIKAVCYEKAGAMMYDKLDIRKGELGGLSGILGASMLFES